MDLLEIVLDSNIFEFNGNLWQQKIGTAMGTRVAPTYACLFMGWLEELILGLWSNQQKTKPYLWRRYIDDVFFIWRGDVQELKDFIHFINQQHPNIKFVATFDSETKSIPFLDMLISINKDGYLETDLYKKETARIKYLLPSSCHPGHITKNIPYSLGYRLLRICSNRETFKLRLEELRQNLLLRSYNPKVIQNAFDRILNIERGEALKRIPKTSENNTTIVTNYHPAMPSISKIIKKHWSVMTDDFPEMKSCFPKPSLVAYKRHKNLRDLLIRAKLPPKRGPSRKSNGFKNCGELCNMCPYTPRNSTKNHKSKHTNETYEINSSISCKTSGVIYKIFCNKCPNFTYIGETSRPLKKRFYEHNHDATKKDANKPCGSHFSLPGHSICNMSIIGIEQVFPKEDTLLRKRREHFWIKTYNSVIAGANTRF